MNLVNTLLGTLTNCAQIQQKIISWARYSEFCTEVCIDHTEEMAIHALKNSMDPC